jgi:hypothetical protein
MAKLLSLLSIALASLSSQQHCLQMLELMVFSKKEKSSGSYWSCGHAGHGFLLLSTIFILSVLKRTDGQRGEEGWVSF